MRKRRHASAILYPPCSILCLLTSILVWPLRAEDATFEAPNAEKEIPLEAPQPLKEDSLDRLKKLWPKKQPGSETPAPVADEGEETAPESIPGKIIFQLKDYNWEQNVNLRIGRFTILAYRDATSNDRMLFRFLTPEEHAEKRVMNSKASLLGKPRKTKPTTTK